ncbi:hypothetical protein [Acinetobacter stercoris]|uniref:Internalin n=1 Tax=Acinetobacter stercoris TaxID=2126983 RepID=A0A2U3MVH4_9GAMM|nr:MULTISPECIES: hypothetical protein [Acinetobacter]SPL69299.1 hypothetical protein KPC_0477 [Acinetobacter stercoris]
MNLKLTLAAALVASLTLSACSKQEKAPASEQTSASEAPANDSNQVTPEQQKAIDALDKPVLDEKNKDVPTEISEKPADAATPANDADEVVAK